MMITGFTLTANAVENQTVNGENFIVVKTETELAAALQAGKNVMLANDIELTSAKFPLGEICKIGKYSFP